MTRSLTTGLLFIASYILCNSCKKDIPKCPPANYYDLTSSDLSKIPYTSKETLRFLYRNGVKKDTFVFRPYSTRFDTTDLGGPLISDYCYQNNYGQHKKFVYQNKNLFGQQYQLSIDYTGEAGGADLLIKYDSISIDDALIIINNPGWGHYHHSLTFEGNTFFAVSDYGNGTPTSYYTVYYTAHDGIIRMEYKSGASLTLLP